MEELLCGNVGVGGDGQDKMRSVCPNMTPGNDVETSDRRFPPIQEIIRVLRKELSSLKFTSTPIRATWPISTKKRSSILGEQDEPPCEAVMSDVASGSETVGGGELARGNVTDASEGVLENFVTNGAFSTLRVMHGGTPLS